jgi:hypothetical protein
MNPDKTIPLTHNYGKAPITPTDIRQDKIVKLCNDKPMCKKDLAEKIGVSYDTVRNDIQILLAKQLIRPIDTGYKGTIYYSSKQNAIGYWPILWRAADRSVGWNFKEAVRAVFRMGAWVAGIPTLFNVAQIMINHIELIEAIKTNEDPPTARKLSQIRKELKEQLDVVKADILMFEGFANNDIFWSIEGLEMLGSLDDFFGPSQIRLLQEGVIEFNQRMSEAIAAQGKPLASQLSNQVTPTVKENVDDSNSEERLPEPAVMESDKPKLVKVRIGTAILTKFESNLQPGDEVIG